MTVAVAPEKEKIRMARLEEIDGTVFTVNPSQFNAWQSKGLFDKYKGYRVSWITLQFSCLIGMLCLMVGLFFKVANYAAVVILISLLGIAMITCTPLALDFACEITFPVGEAMSSGFIMSLGQLISIVQVLFIDYMKTKASHYQNAKLSFYIFGAVSIASMITSSIIKGNLCNSNNIASKI